MKVIFHNDFYDVYTSDPASERGRIEAIVDAIEPEVEFITACEAYEEDIERIHTKDHITSVKQEGLYSISALAAGGAIQAALTGLNEPCFALIRPPGHHASGESSWGFCYFNNMAIAIEHLKANGLINTAHILDFDMHYGDGNVNILGDKNYISIHNPESMNRDKYLLDVQDTLNECTADIIGISAGFDNHIDDWGRVLLTEDYFDMGQMAVKAARRNNGGCFAILEGGYNHAVLGKNVLALLKGFSE